MVHERFAMHVDCVCSMVPTLARKTDNSVDFAKISRKAARAAGAASISGQQTQQPQS